MIRLRKECPEIGWGSWEILETGSSAVLAMRYDWRDNSLVLIHNFDALPHDIIVKPNCEGEEKLINLLVEEQSQADQEARHHLPTMRVQVEYREQNPGLRCHPACNSYFHNFVSHLTVFSLFARVGEILSIRRRSFVHDREGLSLCADRAPFWFKPISIFGLLDVTTVHREFTSIDHTTQS
jgi:hypothetical protein